MKFIETHLQINKFILSIKTFIINYPKKSRVTFKNSNLPIFSSFLFYPFKNPITNYFLEKIHFLWKNCISYYIPTKIEVNYALYFEFCNLLKRQIHLLFFLRLPTPSIEKIFNYFLFSEKKIQILQEYKRANRTSMHLLKYIP